MQAKKVILHLGMNKCGSTSIQNTLFNNAAVLEKNGFRYLTEWGLSHLTVFNHLFSASRARAIRKFHGRYISKRKHNKSKKMFLNALQNVIKNSKSETLILSGECFGVFTNKNAINNFKEFIINYFESKGIEVSIVLLIRNPLLWLISRLQQALFFGYYPRNTDFFEERIKSYKAITNLKKNFCDSLKFLKFEDACLDEDGLAGYFLKEIGFPKEKLNELNIITANESRCMEVMEFANYIESVETIFPNDNLKNMNVNRTMSDLCCLENVKGVRFDLPYDCKMELWNRIQDTVIKLEKVTKINYLKYKIPVPSLPQETYNEDTIRGFIDAFPRLNPVLQKYFLKFFEMKYAQTAQVKFKQLYFKNSIPWKIYNSKNLFFSILFFRIKNVLYNTKDLMPRTIINKLKQIRSKYERNA